MKAIAIVIVAGGSGPIQAEKQEWEERIPQSLLEKHPTLVKDVQLLLRTGRVEGALWKLRLPDAKESIPFLRTLLKGEHGKKARATAAYLLAVMKDVEWAQEIWDMFESRVKDKRRGWEFPEPHRFLSPLVAMCRGGKSEWLGEKLLTCFDPQGQAVDRYLTAFMDLRYRPAAPAILPCLKNSKKEWVRLEAAMALAELADKSLAPKLIELLDDGSDSVVGLSLGILTVIGDPTIVEAAAKKAGEGWTRAYFQGLSAKLSGDDQAARKELLQALKDSDDDRRVAAAVVLACLKEDKATLDSLAAAADAAAPMYEAEARPGERDARSESASLIACAALSALCDHGDFDRLGCRLLRYADAISSRYYADSPESAVARFWLIKVPKVPGRGRGPSVEIPMKRLMLRHAELLPRLMRDLLGGKVPGVKDPTEAGWALVTWAYDPTANREVNEKFQHVLVAATQSDDKKVRDLARELIFWVWWIEEHRAPVRFVRPIREE